MGYIAFNTHKRYTFASVEEQAIERAEAECLTDGEARARRREREAERRVQLDREYVECFALRVRELSLAVLPEGRGR